MFWYVLSFILEVLQYNGNLIMKQAPGLHVLINERIKTIQWQLMPWLMTLPWGHLNIKMSFYQYKDPQVKDEVIPVYPPTNLVGRGYNKTVSHSSYL